MRNLAGVLLIIAALVNGVAGGLYILGGGASTVVGQAAESAAHDDAQATATPGQADVTHARAAQSEGHAMMGFGAFLIAMLGLQVAAGVCLFVKKGPAFVAGVGALGLPAEGIGVYLLHHVGVTNVLGLLASLLAIAAALSLRRVRAARTPEATLAMAGR